jgi:hypothetical protein
MWSCANGSPGAAVAETLQDAASATAHAKSFTVGLAGVEVTYQAPDRVQQVEHGQASTASSSSGGTASTSGPFAETITKVFIGNRYYEADGPAGQTPVFSASARCPGQANVADYVLAILRAIATSGDIHAFGGRFAFQIPKGGDVPFPISGMATVASGFVVALSLSPGSGSPPTITISSIDSAPPVTEPRSSTPSNVSCGP